MALFNKLLLAAVILALLFPMPGLALQNYIIAPLSLSIFFSLVASGKEFKLKTEAVKKGIIFNYIVLSLPLVLFALFMPPGIREGLVMYAIFPPAVGIASLSGLWGGDTRDTFVFQLVSYAASIILVPLAAHFLIGENIDASVLLLQLLAIFALPGILSLVVKAKEEKLLGDLSGIFLALVFYLVIAKSRDWMILNWASMLIYSIPLAILCLALGYATYRLTNDPDAVLYSILKNGGAAAAASLGVLPEAALAIISVKAIMDAGLILLFGIFFSKKS